MLPIPPSPPSQKTIRKGDYLWELISPKDKDGVPTKSANGRYRVRLFIMVSSSSLVGCKMAAKAVLAAVPPRLFDSDVTFVVSTVPCAGHVEDGHSG